VRTALAALVAVAALSLVPPVTQAEPPGSGPPTIAGGAQPAQITPVAPASDSGDHFVLTGGFALLPGQAAQDVVVVDGDVRISRGARVQGSLVAGTGDVLIAGTVEGDVRTIGGRARLLPGARIQGDLLYSDEQPIVAPGATVEGKIRHQSWSWSGGWGWAIVGAAALWIAMTASLLVAGIALVALLPGAAEAARRAARSQFALSLAMGIAWGIGFPLLAGLSIISLVGIPLGLVVGLALIPMAFVGYLTASFVLGRLVTADTAHPILAFLAGLGILRALALIPVAGALVWIPAVVIGLGALIVAAMGQGEAEAEA
jgi:hypothetical protein